jgi:hypothetical protein
MMRWTVVSLAVVLAAGAVTAWFSYRLGVHMANHPVKFFGVESDSRDRKPAKAEPGLLVLSTLPTWLLVLAGLLRRRSVRMQAAVAVAALLIAVVRVLVIHSDLSPDSSELLRGLSSALAWLVGVAMAGGVLLVAVVVAGLGWFRRQPEGGPAEPGALAGRAGTG